MAPKKPTGSDKDTAADSGTDAPAPKPAKPAMRPKPAPMHPQQLVGKGGKHPSNPMKGRSFRHQGR